MNKIRPDLLILAAGVGSRYGGLKQLEGVGPHGETIMDYSIFDAIRAGFGRVVFLIKKEHQELFDRQIAPRFRSRIEIAYAFQNIDNLPEGFEVPEGRTKPWGTGHAILCAEALISRPFAVINADDFYGFGAFQTMADTLGAIDSSSEVFFLMGYKLPNTLSEHGSVSRGLCTSSEGFLTMIRELTKVSVSNGQIIYREGNTTGVLDPESIISMNFWGFTPSIFKYLRDGFRSFLKQNGGSSDAEYYITQPVDDVVKSGRARVKLLTTGEKWLGVTYVEDRSAVVKGIQSRIQKGLYPPDLAAE